jgi:hypothetical protein
MLKIKIIAILTLILSGCGGGGGGSSSGGGGTIPTVAFTSWSAVQPNTITEVSGSSQELSYTANPATDTVTSVSSISPNELGAKYFLTTNANNQASALTFQSARGTIVAFNSANGSTLGSSTRYFPTPQNYAKYTGAITGDGSSASLVADERFAGWNYQSYGVWISGRGAGSGTAGVASVGAQTTPNNVPTTGSATFRGSSAGLWLTPVGGYFITTAAMTANVSFANRTIALSTVNTSAASAANVIAGNFGTSVPGLNLNGTLSYAAGASRATGTITTAGVYNGTPMSGPATSTFYGPTASEIGGTFSVNGTGGEAYAGAFGGKR